MINYSELKDRVKVYNGYTGREDIEWSNTWISNADRPVKKRILLIGDSTARMIRSTLERCSKVPVDMIGTSAALDDILFTNILHAFFNDSLYKYDAIFIQLGHHSRINKLGQAYTESDYEKFHNDLMTLLGYLKQFSDNIILETVFLSVKPKKPYQIALNFLGLPIAEIPDEEANFVKRKKNAIIKQVAGESNVSFLDICAYMEEKKIPHRDHIHYIGKAKSIISKEMLKYI